MKSASMPTAAAARASGATYSRSPEVVSPPEPGSCTLCVASMQTGTPSARIMHERPHVHHQVAVAEGGAALGEHDVRRSRPRGTSTMAWRISRGAMNCPFFTFTAGA